MLIKFPALFDRLSKALFLAGFLGCFGLTGAFAQDGAFGQENDPMAPLRADTLERVRATQKIRIGNREAAYPFSFLSEQKEPKGYSIDLCLKVVERLGRELNIPNLKVEYVTVSGAQRIPRLLDGVIDMECGSTTNTKARQEKVAFSYTIFVAGMKILSRADAKVPDIDSLNGKTVALSKGTTSEKLFSLAREGILKGMQVKTFQSNKEALQALVEGKVAAFPQDDILLQGLTSKLPDKNKYVLSEHYLSVEPYAIMVRKRDKRLLAVIDSTLAELYGSGKIQKIYNQWFVSDELNVPLSRLTQEAFTRPAKDTGFAKQLGYSL